MLETNVLKLKLGAWDFFFRIKEFETGKSYLKRISELRNFLIEHDHSPELVTQVMAMELRDQNQSNILIKMMLDETESIEDVSLIYSMISDADSADRIRYFAKRKLEILKSQR